MGSKRIVVYVLNAVAIVAAVSVLVGYPILGTPLLTFAVVPVALFITGYMSVSSSSSSTDAGKRAEEYLRKRETRRERP